MLIENDITITIGNLQEFELAENVSIELGKTVKAHIKIDTGFGRYGFIYTDKESILEVFKQKQNVEIEGVFTHFSDPANDKHSEKQFERFCQCISYIKENRFEPGILHACATTATMKYPHMHLDAVRIGSAIQGRAVLNKDKLRKTGIFKTNIQEIKEVPKGYNISYNNTYTTKKQTKIATIPVGYIDGLNKNKLRDDFSLKNNIISAILEIKKYLQIIQ